MCNYNIILLNFKNEVFSWKFLKKLLLVQFQEARLINFLTVKINDKNEKKENNKIIQGNSKNSK
jgi:hypothetical protein